MTDETLKPCPFCGGPVKLELANVSESLEYGDKNGLRHWYGVVCRNNENLGGTCCMEQVPSASKEAAIARWNMRAYTESQVAVSEHAILKRARAAGLTDSDIDALRSL